MMDQLRTLIRLLRERGFTADGEAILRLLDQEIRRVLDLVRGMLDVVDPDTCPDDLLDFLASLFGVPFLPSAPLAEKLEFLQQALLTTVPADDFPTLAAILGVDLAAYPTVDEQRLALYEATRTATEEQIDQCLYALDAGYLLGVMTPAQKRLAIKQAIAWYRVRGTELSYQILLRVFGLSARIVPLWTENYESFWEEPQGPTVFEGGPWFPTPHYALEFHRWSDHGAVSASVIRLYTDLVRTEVQPIQCVLTRVSFVQDLVDTVAIADEALFDLTVPAVDLSPWPTCWWQDRGRVFTPVPRRDGSVHVRRDRTGGQGYRDDVFLYTGRSVVLWNASVARYRHRWRYRDGEFPGYARVRAYFCRIHPEGPGGLRLLRARAWHLRQGLDVLVPEDRAGDAPFLVCEGRVDPEVELFFPRDPRACEYTDPVHGGVFPEFTEEWSIAAPRDLCSPPRRDGSWVATRTDARIFVDECVGAAVDLTADAVDLTEEPAAVTVDPDADAFCPYVAYRSGADFPRVYPARAPACAYTRAGAPWDRGTPVAARAGDRYLRDGTNPYDRAAWFFRDDVRYRDAYCYLEEADLASNFVDVWIIDDAAPLTVPLTLADDFPEAADAGEMAVGVEEFYQNALHRNVCCGPDYQGERVQRLQPVRRDGSWDHDRADPTTDQRRAGPWRTVTVAVPCRDPLAGDGPRAGAYFARRYGDAPFTRAAPDADRTGGDPRRAAGAFDRAASVLVDGAWRRGDAAPPVHDVDFAVVPAPDFRDAWPAPDDTAVVGGGFEVDLAPDPVPYAPTEAAVEGEAEVTLEDRLCPTFVTRADGPGVRQIAVCYRFEYYPERNRPDCSRAGACYEPRAGGAVFCDRAHPRAARDGGVGTARWTGARRDGAEGWTRDASALDPRFRRRDAVLCYESWLDVAFSADLAPDDPFCYTNFTRSTADFIRDGTACLSRDGVNCCTPGDSLDIEEYRCLTWDAPGCRWDQPGLTWDPSG